MSPLEEAVLHLLQQAGRPLAVAQLAKQLGQSQSAVLRALAKLDDKVVRDGARVSLNK